MLYSFLQGRQSGLYVRAKMHAEGTPVAFGQDTEIPQGLRSFDDAEGVFLARYGKVGRIITGDLQEDAGIGAALVCLSG